MKLSLHPYQLRFKYPFKIAHGIRSYTDVVFVKLEYEGLQAWGEAALPPYLPETQKSVIDFFGKFEKTAHSTSVDEWFEKLGADTSSSMAAKAALDMALWDLKAQLNHTTISTLLGINTAQFPQGAYTIGVCDRHEMKLRVEKATGYGFELFKLKLDGINDEGMIRNFKALSHYPFSVDVNEGWKNVAEAHEKISWLEEENCLMVEQPLPKEMNAEMPALKSKCNLPLFADESCQTAADLENLWDSFDGINVKLMKCGGITPAFQMIQKAKKLGFKILIGCMSESSVGCTAAAWLSPFADYADLDGNYLTVNDPFTGMKIEKGRIKPYTPKQIIKF